MYFKDKSYSRKKRKPSKTKEEIAYLNAVAQLPCIACGARPVEVHHCRIHTGLGIRPSHFDTISLCPEHHRLGKDAVHMNKTLFEQRYGTQEELIERTRNEIKKRSGNGSG